MTPQPIKCPFCAGQIPRDLAESAPADLMCERRQSKSGAYTYFHYAREKPPAFGDWVFNSAEMIPLLYMENALAGRARTISMIGSSEAGKSVCLRALGLLTLYPSPFNNLLHPFFNVKITSVQAIDKDPRMGPILELGLGKLAPSTGIEKEATMALPLRIQLGPKLQERGSMDPPRRGWLNRLILGALGEPSRPSDLSLIIKDVGGEMGRVQHVQNTLADVEAQHLQTSEWYIFAVDARSKHSIHLSCDLAKGFLDLLTQTKGQSRPRQVVVVYTRVDERWMEAGNDPVLDAVALEPNRFTKANFDFPSYLRNLQAVSEAVRQNLEQEAPTLVSDLKTIFDTQSYCALSSLGVTPVSESGGNAFAAQCLCEPMLIRVFDPILWILHHEGMFRLDSYAKPAAERCPGESSS